MCSSAAVRTRSKRRRLAAACSTPDPATAWQAARRAMGAIAGGACRIRQLVPPQHADARGLAGLSGGRPGEDAAADRHVEYAGRRCSRPSDHSLTRPWGQHRRCTDDCKLRSQTLRNWPSRRQPRARLVGFKLKPELVFNSSDAYDEAWDWVVSENISVAWVTRSLLDVRRADQRSEARDRQVECSLP